MHNNRLSQALIQKRTTQFYFWHQKSIPRPEISAIWYFERQNQTRTVEIMANLIFKQIPIHFSAKLLHKLQPPGATIFHKSDPPGFLLKIIIGYVCTFCERPRLIQQHFLKTSHPSVPGAPSPTSGIVSLPLTVNWLAGGPLCFISRSGGFKYF